MLKIWGRKFGYESGTRLPILISTFLKHRIISGSVWKRRLHESRTIASLAGLGTSGALMRLPQCRLPPAPSGIYEPLVSLASGEFDQLPFLVDIGVACYWRMAHDLWHPETRTDDGAKRSNEGKFHPIVLLGAEFPGDKRMNGPGLSHHSYSHSSPISLLQ